MLRRLLRGLQFLIRDSVKTRSHAHVVLARSPYLEREMMKLCVALHAVESGIIRTISDQIISGLIVHDALDPAGYIVGVTNCQSASLRGKVVQTSLCFKKSPASRLQALFDL